MKSKSLSLFTIAALLFVGLVPSVFYSQIATARDNELRPERQTRVEQEDGNEMEIAENTELTKQSIEERKAEAEKKALERRAKADSKVAEIQAKREAAKEERKANKLDATKLKICQRQENKVATVMQRASDQGTRQLEVFKKIADRTQEFATNKNLVVEDYAALVAEVEANYTIAAETMKTISSSSEEFDCEGDDPKLFLSSFRTAHQQKTEAMKAYKTSVKDLIVAVKSSQSNVSETEDTETNENVEAR